MTKAKTTVLLFRIRRKKDGLFYQGYTRVRKNKTDPIPERQWKEVPYFNKSGCFYKTTKPLLLALDYLCCDKPVERMWWSRRTVGYLNSHPSPIDLKKYKLYEIVVTNATFNGTKTMTVAQFIKDHQNAS